MTLQAMLGYLTAILLIASYAMQTITWLRLLAIAGGVALLVYAIVIHHPGLLVIALLLIGVNGWRYFEMRRLVARAREVTAASAAPVSVEWLLPYMRPLDLPKGHTLFRKGDVAEAMYFISAGKIRFDELDIELAKGSLFGEIGIFSIDQIRTATAVCIEPTSLLLLTAVNVRELYYQNPEFGFYLVSLITRRLIEDAQQGKRLKP